MLEQIGVATTDSLFDSIPEALRLRDHLNVPAAMSELELLKQFEEMGRATRRPSAQAFSAAAPIRITFRRSSIT
jgi:glycine cleavage system pyridoxal-binding protein P